MYLPTHARNVYNTVLGLNAVVSSEMCPLFNHIKRFSPIEYNAQWSEPIRRPEQRQKPHQQIAFIGFSPIKTAAQQLNRNALRSYWI